MRYALEPLLGDGLFISDGVCARYRQLRAFLLAQRELYGFRAIAEKRLPHEHRRLRELEFESAFFPHRQKIPAPDHQPPPRRRWFGQACGERWDEIGRRRIVAPIVHVSRLPEYAPVMVEAALEMRERWSQSEGATVDVLAESATLTAEIICRTLFGRKLGHDFARQIVDGFSDYQRVIGQTDLMSLLGLPDWVPRWQGRAVAKSVKRIHHVLAEVIDSYQASRRPDDHSMIARLLDARDPETGAALDPQALRNEIAVLFMAGHETTANALAWCWYLLSQTPEVEAKLHRELDSVLGGRTPTLADVPQLVFSKAIFDEALRLYPPVPILPREAVRDDNFRGVPIPKGSLIFVVPWLLHRHKRLWDRPDHFIPERFLPENAAAISKFSYIPFSVGPRVCAGMSFGLTEAILCLATLAQRFSLRLERDYEVVPVCRLTLRPEGGLPMVIGARSGQP